MPIGAVPSTISPSATTTPIASPVSRGLRRARYSSNEVWRKVLCSRSSTPREIISARSSSRVFRPSTALSASASLARSPLTACEPLRRLVDRLHHRAGRELAELLDLVGVDLPERAEQGAVGLARLGRRRVGDVGLAEVLEHAGAQHLDADADLVERILVVVLHAAEAGDVDRAHRMQVDLVGMGGDVVLALVEARAPGHHLLALGAEAVDRGADLAQGRQAGGVELVEDQHGARRSSRPWPRCRARRARRAAASSAAWSRRAAGRARSSAGCRRAARRSSRRGRARARSSRPAAAGRCAPGTGHHGQDEQEDQVRARPGG